MNASTCPATLGNLGGLRCTLRPDEHPGRGHRYDASDCPDRHDQTEAVES